MLNHKIPVKVKPKIYHDEYVLTHKYIICKFKYIVLCFDDSDESDNHGCIVNLSAERLKELLVEQNMIFDSSKDSETFKQILKDLKNWHPSISRVEIDQDSICEMSTISTYPINWIQCEPYLKHMSHNHCILNDVDFTSFKQQKQLVVDVRVYFQLVKRIDNVESYNVNFTYLHNMLSQYITQLEPSYLDEVSVTRQQVPFADRMGYQSVENDTYCVYPYMYLIPLYPSHIQ